MKPCLAKQASCSIKASLTSFSKNKSIKQKQKGLLRIKEKQELQMALLSIK